MLMYDNNTVIENLISIFGDNYKYNLVNYTGQFTPIKLICPEHGEFSRRTRFLFLGKGCQKCSKKGAVEKQRRAIMKSQGDFINEVQQLNPLLDFSNTIYKGWRTPILAKCKIHGDISLDIERLRKGLGCGKCGYQTFADTRRWDYDEFIEKVNEIHNNFYQYPIQEINVPKIEIYCPIHDIFLQRPSSHLRGAGCIKCSKSGKSNIEQLWLDSLMIPQDNRHKFMKIDSRRFVFDAYDDTFSTIYEFYGDYWHGNPSVYPIDGYNRMTKTTFGNLYQKTIERENYLKIRGYNIISVWEADFRKLTSR